MKVKSKNIHIIASIATVRKLRDTFEPDCSPRGGGGGLNIAVDFSRANGSDITTESMIVVSCAHSDPPA